MSQHKRWLLCYLGVFLLAVFSFNQYSQLSPAIAPPVVSTASPTLRNKAVAPTKRTSGPTLPGPLNQRFICLKDEPDLWQRRLQRANQFQDEFCDGKPLDERYVESKSRGLVPVIFVFGIMNNQPVSEVNRRIIGLALNTAAKFNDHVILLLFGRARDLNIQVARNVEIVEIYEETDPVMVAFQSFGPPLYVHMSGNSLDYELFCFRRWFGIQAFLRKREMQHAFIADNDVLLLANVTREVDQCFVGCRTFGDRVFSVYVRSETVDDFVQYMLSTYLDPAHEALHRAMDAYKVVSDMTVFHQFSQKPDPQTGEVYAHPYCTKWPSPLKSMLKRHNPYEGLGFGGYFYYQDDLQLVVLTHYNEGEPHLLQNLHFQGPQNKAIMARCPEIKL